MIDIVLKEENINRQNINRDSKKILERQIKGMGKWRNGEILKVTKDYIKLVT